MPRIDPGHVGLADLDVEPQVLAVLVRVAVRVSSCSSFGVADVAVVELGAGLARLDVGLEAHGRSWWNGRRRSRPPGWPRRSGHRARPPPACRRLIHLPGRDGTGCGRRETVVVDLAPPCSRYCRRWSTGAPRYRSRRRRRWEIACRSRRACHRRRRPSCPRRSRRRGRCRGCSAPAGSSGCRSR